MLFKKTDFKKTQRIPFEPIYLDGGRVRFNIGYIINEKISEKKTGNHSLLNIDNNYYEKLFKSGSYFVFPENINEIYSLNKGDKFYLILNFDKYGFVKWCKIRQIKESERESFFDEVGNFGEKKVAILLCEEDSEKEAINLKQKIKENIFLQNERFILKPFTIIRLEKNKYRIFGGSIYIDDANTDDDIRSQLFQQGKDASYSILIDNRIYVEDKDIFANPGDYIYLSLYFNFSSNIYSLALYSDTLVGLAPSPDPSDEELPPPLEDSIKVGLFSSFDSVEASFVVTPAIIGQQAIASKVEEGSGPKGVYPFFLGKIGENGEVETTGFSGEINNDLYLSFEFYRNESELTDFSQIAASEGWFQGSYPDDGRIREVFNIAVQERQGDWSNERARVFTSNTIKSRTKLHY